MSILFVVSDLTLNLPLSWRIGPEQEKLLLGPVFRSRWIASVGFRSEEDFPEYLNHRLFLREKGLVFRGADSGTADIVTRHGGRKFQSGLEAVVPVHQAFRRSVRDLARRALRRGEIRFWHRDEANPPDLIQLRSRSVYARRPQLQGLFLTQPEEWDFAWEYIGAGGIQGLVSVTRRGRDSWHTEILMRARHAPVGTMEALLLQALVDLRDMGARELSLGECPFILGDPPGVRMHFTGVMMSHAYHARGLFRFKSKFDPVWRPAYVCSSGPLLPALIDLFFASGSARLFLHLSSR